MLSSSFFRRLFPQWVCVPFLILLAAVSGCSSTNPPSTEPLSQSGTASDQKNSPSPSPKRWLGIFSPYKIDIQQGNFVSQEVASKLKEGMTKEQVRFLLGAPLLTDMFHVERWDYLFRMQKGSGEITNNRLTIFFNNDRVQRFESTNLPVESEYLTHISGSEPKKDINNGKDKANTKPESTPTPNHSD
jgi:outer membrane protein assembly factor BamE